MSANSVNVNISYMYLIGELCDQSTLIIADDDSLLSNTDVVAQSDEGWFSLLIAYCICYCNSF